jgi:hypothetical protein
MSLAQLVDICIIMQGIGVRTPVIPLIRVEFQAIRLLDQIKTIILLMLLNYHY